MATIRGALYFMFLAPPPPNPGSDTVLAVLTEPRNTLVEGSGDLHVQ